MKKAVVFDNSGTLIERFRVIKDVLNGNIFTDINSLDLIDAADSLALVVLQFNTNRLLKLDQNILVSDIIKEYDIDLDKEVAEKVLYKVRDLSVKLKRALFDKELVQIYKDLKRI